MEVHFTPEQEAQLSRIATHAGMDTEHLVKDAALRVLEERNRELIAMMKSNALSVNDLKIISRHIERQRNPAAANKIPKCGAFSQDFQVASRF